MAQQPRKLNSIEPSRDVIMFSEELTALLIKYQGRVSLGEALATMGQACGYGVFAHGPDDRDQREAARNTVIANMDMRIRDYLSGRVEKQTEN